MVGTNPFMLDTCDFVLNSGTYFTYPNGDLTCPVVSKNGVFSFCATMWLLCLFALLGYSISHDISNLPILRLRQNAPVL